VLTKIDFGYQILVTCSTIKFHENPFIFLRVVLYMQMDGVILILCLQTVEWIDFDGTPHGCEHAKKGHFC
jgi:hypothetical protein